jgi:hypothetical protein
VRGRVVEDLVLEHAHQDRREEALRERRASSEPRRAHSGASQSAGCRGGGAVTVSSSTVTIELKIENQRISRCCGALTSTWSRLVRCDLLQRTE